MYRSRRSGRLEQAAKMHSVYSNSFLTTPVTSAKDGSTDCFANRPLKEYIKLTHTSKDGISGDVFAFALPIYKEVDTNKYITIDNEPVTGWCIQERVLSRRILHFATDQMYFECMEDFRSEDGTQLPILYFSMHGKLGSSRLPVHRVSNPTSYNDLRYHFLCSSGPWKLTKGSDKLPALSGIAAMFSENLSDQYSAGIWQNSMIQDLLWQGLEIVQIEDRNLSWSWAYINGIPANALIGRWEPIGHILDCHAAVQGTNRFGTVAEAWIKMEVPLIPLLLHEV
ncbi:hypothetical protein K469DRAFT_583369 [Zopfia rhizophila CBS 207.26]|uniref:Heterokaryon incompatibility domain-containing protein n=1 Tax=Zopfia rhizophila CBS 207.26 TaxID=1314779 RepID=A0A6A6DX34_9PEZI|nr:hypothetical protein K469DRAFT_583369 [Zopfia rhizophila CBS 207.26]